MKILLIFFFSFHCRVVFGGVFCFIFLNLCPRELHGTPARYLVNRGGSWGGSDLPKVTQGLVNYRPSDMAGSHELIVFDSHPQLYTWILPHPSALSPAPVLGRPWPGCWCYCCFQTPASPRWRQTRMSVPGRSCPGRGTAGHRVPCRGTQTWPGSRSGCTWPAGWHAASPGGCTDTRSHRECRPSRSGASTHLACKTGPGKEPTGPRSFNPGPLPSMPLGLLPPWIQALTSRHLLEEVFPDYPATFFKRSSLTTPRIRMPTVFCSVIQLFFSFRAHITTWHLHTCLLPPPTPTSSQWKLPESGVYTSLTHPQCAEQGLAHSGCLIHLFLEWTCEGMNEWMNDYILCAGSEDVSLRKSRSACCPHKVYDLVGEGIMKWILIKQRSNFALTSNDARTWRKRSRGERSCTGINTSRGPEEGQRVGSKGTKTGH